jgi:hypothetical protein
MKRSLFRGVLAAEALVCVLLCFLKTSLTGVFSAAIAFPFEQIGQGLRALSLSGGFGNVIAIVLYALIGLLPVALLLLRAKKQKLHLEDWLLALLSAVLFGVLYLMLNPGFIPKVLGMAAQPPIGQAILGGMVYSLIVGYLFLRALRLFAAGNTEKLERYMAIMLGALNVLFVFMAFGACFSDMLASIAALRAGNSGNENLLGASYVFLVLQYLVNALPYMLDIVVVFAALRLLDEMRNERYSAAAVAAAGRMSRLCAVALTITILSNIAFNLLQLLFASSLMVMNHSVQIPVLSILFVLAALLLTRFVMESKQLKDENDAFI